MPVYGTVPLLSMHEIAQRTKAIDGTMRQIGATLPKPFLTLQTIPFTGLPFLRITDRGLADIRNKKLVPLFLD
jgi:adenine deaminase